MPQVVVIAGPNGAGKTTVSRALLTKVLRSRAFVNLDNSHPSGHRLIAVGLQTTVASVIDSQTWAIFSKDPAT